jgi:hypothetical protein
VLAGPPGLELTGPPSVAINLPSEGSSRISGPMLEKSERGVNVIIPIFVIASARRADDLGSNPARVNVREQENLSCC